MEFNVSIISGEMVAPSRPTPIGTKLELSVIDKLEVLRCNARTLHLFKNAPPEAAPAGTIRRALADALVPYYPLAGKLEGPQIACNGDGVWFVEAVADCNLDSVSRHFDAADFPYEKLLPPPPPSQRPLSGQDSTSRATVILSDEPLVQMQVTRFQCGGFVIGLIFCHSVCDGLGAAQFLNAVGQLARGISPSNLNPTPKWERDFLKLPQRSKKPSLPPPSLSIIDEDQELVQATFDISLERIKQMKQQFQEYGGEGSSRCSTFELVAAILWVERTRAVITSKDEIDARIVKLVFFANCRRLVEPPLADGFYGNCFFPVTATARASALLSSGDSSPSEDGVFQAVKLIQRTKSDLPNQFGEWIRKQSSDGDGSASERSSQFSDPFAPPHELEYAADLFVSEWGRLGFNEVDYGWGTPVGVVPIQGSSVIPAAIVCSPPTPKKAVRLMTWCVRRSHLRPLLHNISNY